jgi:hypothetical protein
MDFSLLNYVVPDAINRRQKAEGVGLQTVNIYFARHSSDYSAVYLFVAQQPKSNLGRLVFEVPRTHSIRHPHQVGLPGTSHRSVAEAATYTTRNKHKRRTPMPLAGFEPRSQQ